MKPPSSLVIKIVEHIAAQQGVDPIDLDSPLYDSIDTDALETLIESARDSPQNSCSVEFPYHDYIVTVDETRSISIREKESAVPADD